ncbi:MAG: tetratricopeptide repeat protein [Bacteroidota bacterium]
MQRAGYFLLTLMLLSGNLDYASGGSPDEPDSVVLRKRILEMEDGMLADYPVALAKAKQVHQAALESSCLSCIALSHKLQGKFLLENGEYPVSLIHFRKAASLFERLNDRATLAAVLDQIGIIHYYQAYYDSGAYYFDKALRTYEVDKNLQGMITVLHNTALMYHRKGDFQKSIGFLFREEQLKDQLGQSNHEIEALANMGSLMVDSIYYQEEIADELKAIEIHRKTNDRRSISRAYRNIGKAYRQLENYRLAAQYFVMAARIMDELGFVPEWDLAATDYRDANQKDSCFYYHYLAKQDFKRKMQPDIAYTLDLLGDAHRYFNQHDSALYYYDSALNMSYRMNNRITFTGIHWHLVNVHTALGNFKEAERHLAKGLALAKEVALIHEKNFYREGKVLYEKMGDYKKALIFSEKYRVLIDSINRAETALNLTKMQAEFKTAKKARQGR